MRFTLLLLPVWLCSLTAHAQWDVGGGAQLHSPLMYNKYVGSYNHTLGSKGVNVGVKYYPQYRTFFPSAGADVSTTLLPLIKEGEVVISMVFLQMNLMAGANVRKVYENGNELQYGASVGITYMDARELSLNTTTDNSGYRLASSSLTPENHITRWMPSMRLGGEYVFRISQEKPLYAGIGGRVQYIYFFDDNERYEVYVNNNSGQMGKLQVNLLGHFINPGVTLSVYYRFAGGNRY